jgi:hypothetical protein
MENSNDMIFVYTGMNTFVGYWIECSTCHTKLTKVDDDSCKDSPASAAIRMAVAEYHTKTTGHEMFVMGSVTRHLQCYLCKENPPTDAVIGPTASFVAQEARILQHRIDTGHKFFAFSED